MTIDQTIAALHKTLLAALRVDYFPPGMGDLNAWRDFLFVQRSLDDSLGGPLAPHDVRAVIALMREQNREGKAKWALRLHKILSEPEAFRDLVLETRRTKRPRPALERGSRSAGGLTIETERDPAAENEARPVKELLEEFKRKMRPGAESMEQGAS